MSICNLGRLPHVLKKPSLLAPYIFAKLTQIFKFLNRYCTALPTPPGPALPCLAFKLVPGCMWPALTCISSLSHSLSPHTLSPPRVGHLLRQPLSLQNQLCPLKLMPYTIQPLVLCPVRLKYKWQSGLKLTSLHNPSPALTWHSLPSQSLIWYYFEIIWHCFAINSALLRITSKLHCHHLSINLPLLCHNFGITLALLWRYLRLLVIDLD